MPISRKLKSGAVIILRSSLFVDTGQFHLRDTPLKMIAMMTKTQDPQVEIWEIKEVF